MEGAGGTIGPPTAVDRGRKAEKRKYVYEEKKNKDAARRNCGKLRAIHVRGAWLPASFKHKSVNQAF